MKEINYYLWKLKYLKGYKIRRGDLNKKDLPDNVHYSKWSGNYTKVECTEINREDLELFLKVKNEYNFNIIKICVVICTIFFVIGAITYID